MRSHRVSLLESAAASVSALLLIFTILISSIRAHERIDATVDDVPEAVPTPVQIRGNPTCADLNASTNPAFAHIGENWGLKIDRAAKNPFDQVFRFGGTGTELQGGAGADPGSWVRAQASGNTLNWVSNRLITAVIVKGGRDGANVYPYAPASLGGFPGGNGTGLTTGSANAISHIVFCFESLGPSAAMVSLSGRVMTVDGIGLAKTYLTLTGPDGSTRVALTNGFGYYRFDDVEAGRQYVITPIKKGYNFEPRVISLSDELSDVDFVGTPR